MARVPGFFGAWTHIYGGLIVTLDCHCANPAHEVCLTGHQTDRSRGDLARPDIPMSQCENMTAGTYLMIAAV